eukprot:2823316-Amphidinium_carterae.1
MSELALCSAVLLLTDNIGQTLNIKMKAGVPPKSCFDREHWTNTNSYLEHLSKRQLQTPSSPYQAS